MIINVYRSSCKVPVFIVRFLMKFEFSQHIFDKYSNIKFRESPSSGSRMVPCGQTDRTKLTVTLCICVYVPNNSEHVAAPVRLILCHSFKPIFFNLGLVSLFQCVWPNCRWFLEKILSHLENLSLPASNFRLFPPLCPAPAIPALIKHHATKMCELRYRSTHSKPGH
jgi:hypothetical protein